MGGGQASPLSSHHSWRILVFIFWNRSFILFTYTSLKLPYGVIEAYFVPLVRVRRVHGHITIRNDYHSHTTRSIGTTVMIPNIVHINIKHAGCDVWCGVSAYDVEDRTDVFFSMHVRSSSLVLICRRGRMCTRYRSATLIAATSPLRLDQLRCCHGKRRYCISLCRIISPSFADAYCTSDDSEMF